MAKSSVPGLEKNIGLNTKWSERNIPVEPKTSPRNCSCGYKMRLVPGSNKHLRRKNHKLGSHHQAWEAKQNKVNNV